MNAKEHIPKGYCLITGASAGIGLEFAKVFAEKGHDLILVARTQSKLEELAELLKRSYPVQIKVVAKDLAIKKDRESLFEETSKNNIFVETLVNNAGFGISGEFFKQEAIRQLEMIELNVSALTHLTRLYLPAMMEKNSGFILNVASTAAFVPGPLMAIYYATKAYVVSLTEALAAEVEGRQINITALCPGPTRTEFQKVAQIQTTKLFESAAMEARPVAEFGYHHLMSGKKWVVIPGFKNKFLAASAAFAPRNLLARTVKRLHKPRVARD